MLSRCCGPRFCVILRRQVVPGIFTLYSDKIDVHSGYLDAVCIIGYTRLNNQQEVNPKFYILLEILHQQILL